MRIAALIFSLIGSYFLLRRADFAFQFIPLQASGPEGGLIEIGIDMTFGLGASVLASVLAFIHLLHTRSMASRSSKLSGVLLAWCCLVLLGFVGFCL
jgi:hypothetical protein